MTPRMEGKSDDVGRKNRIFTGRIFPHWFESVSLGELRHHLRQISEPQCVLRNLEVAVGNPEVIVPVKRIDFKMKPSCLEVRFKVTEFGRQFLTVLDAELERSGADYRLRRSTKRKSLSQVIPQVSLESTFAYSAVENLFRFYLSQQGFVQDQRVAVGYPYGRIPGDVPGEFRSFDTHSNLGYRSGRFVRKVVESLRNFI